MREVGQNLTVAKEKAKRLLNLPAIVKIKTQRGKSETAKGQITSLFPNVFSVTFEDGKARTFSYADILTGAIKFLNPSKTVDKSETKDKEPLTTKNPSCDG